VTGMGLLKSVACYERLSVYAVFHPSEDTLLKALLCHPLVPSYSIARASLSYLMKQVQER
jgi:alpha-galactosidase/6-phospho-beta-glucosidase family protein